MKGEVRRREGGGKEELRGREGGGVWGVFAPRSSPPISSLDQVHFDALDVREPDLCLPRLLSRPAVAGAVRQRAAAAAAVRLGRAAAVLRCLGGKQRGVDVLTDVLDVGGALQHGADGCGCIEN